MPRTLHISPKLTFPADAVTSTLVVYGGKGMGKTNFGVVLAEECAAAHLRFAILDPIGNWFGLRHAADGKGLGVEVLILGGKHGDLPIEPTGGAVVADLVADEDVDVIIDISRRADGKMWSLGERIRFVADFATRLYERQGERLQPRLLIVDEAGRFVPQLIPHGSPDVARCVGAVERIVEEGRNVGVGVCLITQRSARMNKSVSELAECMVAFRTVGPLSIDAVLDWFGEHVEKARWKELVEQLRVLPRGTALVVSPGWLEFEGQAPIRERRTFDSSATPKAGQERRAAGPGAKPDLGKYRDRMAATIEKAKQEDPRELRRRIADLERQVKAIPPKGIPGKGIPTEVRRVAVPILKDAQVKRLEALTGHVVKAADRLEGVRSGAQAIAHELAQVSGEIVRAVQAALVSAQQAQARTAMLPARTQNVSQQESPSVLHSRSVERRLAIQRAPGSMPAEGLSKMLRAMLTTLAQHSEGLTKRKIRIYTGYADSGPVSSAFATLNTNGWAETLQDGRLRLTQAGYDALGPFEPLPTGQALREMVLDDPERSTMERAFLVLLFQAYPGPLSKAQLREKAGYADSGPVSSAFGHIVGRDWAVSVGRGMLRAAEEFFA